MSISFNVNGPGKSVFLIDTGAQRSCMGKHTFLKLGCNLESLNKSYIFGDGPSSSSIGRAKFEVLDHVFNIDIVSPNIPGLIGMDILTSKYIDRNIFFLNLVDRQLTVDNEDIELLGDRQSHLRLPDSLIKISSKFRWTRSSSSTVSETNATYYQDKHVLRADRAGGQELHIVGRRQLEESPQPLRLQTKAS
jgi:hypothetical protein